MTSFIVFAHGIERGIGERGGSRRGTASRRARALEPVLKPRFWAAGGRLWQKP